MLSTFSPEADPGVGMGALKIFDHGLAHMALHESSGALYGPGCNPLP